jgi:hypothetical protein
MIAAVANLSCGGIGGGAVVAAQGFMRTAADETLTSWAPVAARHRAPCPLVWVGERARSERDKDFANSEIRLLPLL